MLQELSLRARGKKQFISTYTPIRHTVEGFLQGGQKNNGLPIERVRSLFDNLVTSLFLGRVVKEYPRYEREITAMVTGPADPIQITARTEGCIYPYSKDIEGSYILVTAKGTEREGDQDGPLVVLPPLRAFQTDEVRWEMFADIPQRISEVLPLLPQKLSGSVR